MIFISTYNPEESVILYVTGDCTKEEVTEDINVVYNLTQEIIGVELTTVKELTVGALKKLSKVIPNELMKKLMDEVFIGEEEENE